MERFLDQLSCHGFDMLAEIFEQVADAFEGPYHPFDVGQSPNTPTKRDSIPTGKCSLDFRLIFLYKRGRGNLGNFDKLVLNDFEKLGKFPP